MPPSTSGSKNYTDHLQASDDDDQSSSQSLPHAPAQQQPLNLSIRESNLQPIPEHSAAGYSHDEPAAADSRLSLPGYSDQYSIAGTSSDIDNPHSGEQVREYFSTIRTTGYGGPQPSPENYAHTPAELRSLGYALVPVNPNPNEIRAGYYTAEELEIIQTVLVDNEAARQVYEASQTESVDRQYNPHDVETEYPSDMEYPTHLDRWRDDEDDYYTSTSEKEEEDAPIPTVIDTQEEDTSKSRTRPQTIQDSAYNSFWQYRREPKGPQGRKFEIDVPVVANPHEPIKFRDPAFTDGKKLTLTHFGKPRVGEGNDMTPNPEKLLQLGTEIEELTEKMSKLGDTSADRKEKMKLSGRICRIKRTANHEANKIKLSGLEKEREELSKAIKEVRSRTPGSEVKGHASLPLQETTEKIVEQIYHTKVAGRTGEYVNSVLEASKDDTGQDSSD